MRRLDGITNSMDMSLKQALGVGDGQRSLTCCSPLRYDRVTELMMVIAPDL